MTTMSYREWDSMGRLERVTFLRRTRQVWHSFIYENSKPVGLRFETNPRADDDAWLRDVETRRRVADARYTALKDGVPYSAVHFPEPPYPFKAEPSVQTEFTPTATEREAASNSKWDPVFGPLALQDID